jgi:hypothetical protein
MRPGSMIFSLVWRSGGFREYPAGPLAPQDRNKTRKRNVLAGRVQLMRHLS